MRQVLELPCVNLKSYSYPFLTGNFAIFSSTYTLPGHMKYVSQMAKCVGICFTYGKHVCLHTWKHVCLHTEACIVTYPVATPTLRLDVSRLLETEPGDASRSDDSILVPNMISFTVLQTSMNLFTETLVKMAGEVSLSHVYLFLL